MSFQRFDGTTVLAKRRTIEQARTAKILDDKTRMMGINTRDLDTQVAEKARIRQWQKDEQDLHANQLIQLDKHCCLIDAELQSLRRQKAKEINEYRKGYQRREQRREWDLNDPRSLGRDAPTRIGDCDIRLGPSSIQMFEGEDVTKPERKKIMAQQVRVWTQQQVDEKDVRKWAEYEDRKEWEDAEEDMNQKAHEMAKALATERRRIAEETALYNKSLSEQQKMQMHRDKFREQQANMAEIQQALDSDLLTESLAPTVNSNNPHRYKPDHMKGLLPSHRQQIQDEQEQQRQNNAERRRLEGKQDRTLDIQMAQQRRMAQILDRQQMRERRSESKKLQEDRRQQAYEAAERKNTLNKLYSNDVGEEFHARFGSSIR
mmetsp:Transcript_64830/g.115339  ORF Transcript_64830/g.115339 Transcript_64830/m.115339 type:complete len:375 (-) Transcript_64830:715-1839(-)